MRREMREHYLAEQLEHERNGEWETANFVNQWLTGAFATAADYLHDHLPPIPVWSGNRID